MGTVIKNGIAITELNPNKGGGGGGSMETIMSTGAADTPQGVVWHDGEGVEITGTLVPSQNTTNKLYFVPAEGQGEDMFDEYITLLADGDYVWERFGSAISVIADIIYGYMNGGIFYKTKNGASYTEPIVPEINRQYTDKDTGIPYIWNGASYMPLNKKPYLSLERLRPYLYRVTFDSLPEDGGGESPVLGACSSYVLDGKLYRNLDFKYDNAASFIVRTKDFEGMSFITGLNDGQMNDSLIAQLPYRVVDGRNSHGIMVSTHVLFNDWGWAGAGNRNISLTRLPFEVLTRVKSMATIATDLDEILGNLYASVGLQAMEYLLQVLVTDGTTTYAILPPTSEGEAFVLQDITSNPKLTNFRWLAQAEVSRFDMDMQDRPTGIERFNLMPCDLSELRFTKAYETADRLSEFIGLRDTTKSSTDAELEAIYDEARALYLDRERDGQIWQTMHSVVYGNGMENLWIQENWNDNCVAGTALHENPKLHVFASTADWQAASLNYNADEISYITGTNAVMYGPYVPPVQPNDEIWYESNTNNVIAPYTVTGFGASIVSNTYTGGKGIIKFDGNVTAIPMMAFGNSVANSKLTKINLPDSVTEIGVGAFSNFGGGTPALEEINMGTQLESIGNGNFSMCLNLHTIICKAIVPPSGSIPLTSGGTLKSIYVPANSVEAYKAAWSNVAEIIKAI